MRHFPFSLMAACTFVLATEFLGGNELLAVLLVVAAVQGALASGWRADRKAIAMSHVLLGLAYATIHAVLRCGRPLAYPPTIILGGLWCAALMVVAAAVATAIVARLRRL
jgi:small ligand-binding sensory domain FIST